MIAQERHAHSIRECQCESHAAAVRGEIKFGFSTPPAWGEEVEWATACEDAGASLLLVGEAPTVFGDPFVHLARVAEHTERMRMGTSVTMPGLRHKAVLARTAASLQALSRGRFVLGIGTGEFGTSDLGLSPASFDELITYSNDLRKLWSGETALVDGQALRLRNVDHDVPVWLAADGPRGQRAAGATADGVIVSNGAHPDLVRHATAHVRRGAKDAGRDPNDVEIWFLVRVDLGPADRSGIHRPGLDEYGSRLTNILLRGLRPQAEAIRLGLARRKGIDISADLAERLALYQQSFVESASYQTSDNPNVALLDRLGLRSFAGDLFFVAGTIQEVVDRLRVLVEAGVRNFCVPQVQHDRLARSQEIADIFRQVAAGRAVSDA